MSSLLRPDGTLCAIGEPGEIAVRRPDPAMFLSYWQDPDATRGEVFATISCCTGDQAVRDEDGYVRFLGRDDDIITSSGYRIGPSEIEDCLSRHPAIAYAAAIGKPDALRTEIVKAFVVLKPGKAASPDADGGHPEPSCASVFPRTNIRARSPMSTPCP